MKNTLLILSFVFVFLNACQITGSEKNSSPEIAIKTLPILVGQEINVEITSSGDFIMPYCGGIVYTIEKLDSNTWTFFDAQNGPCDTLMKPEKSISKSTNIYLKIDEEGTYRFVSSFKVTSDDEMESIYSERFEVK